MTAGEEKFDRRRQEKASSLLMMLLMYACGFVGCKSYRGVLAPDPLSHFSHC